MNKSQVRKAYQKYLENIDTLPVFLCQAYGRPSKEKERIMEECIAFKTKCSGYGGRIISYNTFVFTYGFMAELADKYFIYITPTNDYKLNTRTGEVSYL